MLSVIINIIAVIFGVCYSRKTSKKYYSIVVFYFILSGWFGLSGRIVGDDRIFKAYDFCIIYILLLSIIHRNIIKLQIIGNYGKYLKIFLLTHALLLIYTITMGYESAPMAIKNIRSVLLYTAFFPMLIYKKNDMEKAFRFIVVVEILLGVNFLLQYAGIFILKSYDEIRMDGGQERFLNVPVWFLFYLIYITVTKQKIRGKYFWLCFFGSLLILPMSRMRVLFFCGAICYYYIVLRHEIKRFLKIGTIAAVIAVALSPFLLARVNSKSTNVSMMDDISFALTNKNFSNYNSDEAGTLGFRISMLAERVYYLIDHPEYLLSGVGLRHEESPNCYRNFNFMLGTYSENMPNLKAELHSVDNNWVFICIEMGLIGVILYLSLMFVVCKTLYNNRENEIILSGYLYMLIYSFGSITEAVWSDNPLFVILLSLLMAYTIKYEQEKNKIGNNNTGIQKRLS